ncbi:MAG: hypothetical protein JSU73_06095 [candidate division WOR-3 bacterium]|nr:MAG: hypothetical protein JSU73_06095 [candidate division WOR-3 bacterium]
MPNSSAARFVVIGVFGCAAVAGAQFFLHTVDVGSSPNALAIDTIDHKVFVSCEGSDSVYVLDPTANLPEEFVTAKVAVGDYPSAVTWNPADNTMWVVNKEINSPNGSVTVIEASSDSVIVTVEVGNAPFKAVWASAGNKMYTLGSSIAAAIDCSAYQVVGWIGVPEPEAYGFTDMVYNPSMDRLYLTAREHQGQGGQLHVVDCTIDQIIQTVDVAYGAVRIAYAPSANRAFIACNEQQVLNVIDCASNAVIGWLPISRSPTAVLWSPPPVNRVWVACGLQGHSVFHMQADLLAIEGSVETGDSTPSSLLYNPYTKNLMVACELEHEILWLSGRIPSFGILNRLDLEAESQNRSHGPFAMALYQPMNRVFVANYWDREPGTVSVIRDFIGIEESPGTQSPLPSRAKPNPVGPGNRIMLQASGFEPLRATLVDALGRTVYRGGLGRNGAVTAPGESGVYFYTVTDGRLTSSGKFAVR